MSGYGPVSPDDVDYPDGPPDETYLVGGTEPPIDCRNCEDSDPGAIHALDQWCALTAHNPDCEFSPPHFLHLCGPYPKDLPK